MDISESLTAEC